MGSQSWGLRGAFLGAAEAGETWPGGDVPTNGGSWVMLFPEGGQTQEPKCCQKHHPKIIASLTLLPIPVHRAEVAAGLGDRSSWGFTVPRCKQGTSILLLQGLNNSLELFATSAEQNLPPASKIHVRTT